MNKEPEPSSRFTRTAWLTAVLILVMVIFAIVDLVYRFSLPTDGYLWNNSQSEENGKLFMQNINGGPSPLQAGDRVFALEGIALDQISSDSALREAWQFGATLDYSVLRDGRKFVVPVTLVHWDLKSWVANRLLVPSYLADILSSLALLAIAGAIFVRRPDNPAASPFLIFMAVLSLSSLSEMLPTGFQPRVIPLVGFIQNQVNFSLLLVLLPYALIHFALVFPHPKPILRRRPWLPSAALLFGFLLLFTWRTSPISWFWLLGSLFLALAILVHNAFTMRDPVSRAQVRWGVGGVLIGIGAIAIMLTVNTLGLVQLSDRAFHLVGTFSTTVMGVMISVAITRYRLFDIDVIIRRTLQYALLTALLALVYFGGVILLQELFGRLTGDENSPLVTVISTLAIAALFGRLRVRTQEFIDRRFYRRKYDAEQALAQFAATARDEVDMDKLTAAMLDVVANTMQPANARLWIRPMMEGHHE